MLELNGAAEFGGHCYKRLLRAIYCWYKNLDNSRFKCPKKQTKHCFFLLTDSFHFWRNIKPDTPLQMWSNPTLSRSGKCWQVKKTQKNIKERHREKDRCVERRGGKCKDPNVLISFSFPFHNTPCYPEHLHPLNLWPSLKLKHIGLSVSLGRVNIDEEADLNVDVTFTLLLELLFIEGLVSKPLTGQ